MFIFAGSFLPLIYAPLIGLSEASAAPIALAFYEPGHYRSVVDDAGFQLHHNIEALQRNPVNTAPPINSPVYDKERQTSSMSYDNAAINVNIYTHTTFK